MSRRSPTLLELCLAEVVENLVVYACELRVLPSDLALSLTRAVLGSRPRPLLHELMVLCEAFWRPPSICLHAALNLNTQGLRYLSCTAASLVKLDLSSNAWLDSLDFLPRLSLLRCLDMENVYSITDTFASYHLTRMTTLQSLNLSGTGVSDHFLDALTYSQRMLLWVQSSRVNTERSVHHWHPLEIVYLRLKDTKISEASIPFLSSFQKLLFLDVRNTEISGKSVKILQAKHRLMSLPNNAKVVAQSNSMFLATLRGACGCSTFVANVCAYHCKYQGQRDWYMEWEQNSIALLLQTASKLAQHQRA